MPKMIVLAFGSSASALPQAEAAASGARGVRFMEVDIRVDDAGASSESSRLTQLDLASELAAYDGVLISCGDVDDVPQSLAMLLEELETSTPPTVLANTVFGATSANASLLDRIARLGGIIVSQPRGYDDAEARASALGARMAKVIAWVRHALNHEQKDRAHG